MSDEKIIKTSSNNIEFTGVTHEAMESMPPELEKQLRENARNVKVASTIIGGKDGIIKTRNKNIYEEGRNVTLYPPVEEGIRVTDNDSNFNTLFQELKTDMREREIRTREEINKREERFEKTVDKYHEDNKEREERVFAAIERLENKIVEENKEMKTSLERSEKRIDDSVNHLDSMKRTSFWGQIGFLVGVAAIIVTFITYMS